MAAARFSVFISFGNGIGDRNTGFKGMGGLGFRGGSDVKLGGLSRKVSSVGKNLGGFVS